MEQRLQKLIASRGLTSRRGAEELLRQGLVSVNGSPAKLGDSADPARDTVLVSGKPLPAENPSVVLMLHKPRGYVTTLSDEKGRPNAAQLVAGCGVRVYPIGRLDMDSEGLLLFTNDGELANRVMHPSGEVEKCYEVWVRGYTPAGFARLSQPMRLDGYLLQPPALTQPESSGEKARFCITIHEGRNRQVRRMCEIAGMTVTRLRRIREGGLVLGDLQPGQWRMLTPQERESL